MCGRTREGERENCPASGIVASLQLATVRLYDDPADRQSNTEAARLRGHKGLKQLLPYFLRQPGSRVRDAHFDHPVRGQVCADTQGKSFTIRHRLDGIAY